MIEKIIPKVEKMLPNKIESRMNNNIPIEFEIISLEKISLDKYSKYIDEVYKFMQKPIAKIKIQIVKKLFFSSKRNKDSGYENNINNTYNIKLIFFK